MIPTAIYLPLLVLAANVPQPPAALEATTQKTSLRIVAAGMPVDGFPGQGVGGDPDYGVGLEGDVLFAPGPHLRLGVAFRYELGLPAPDSRDPNKILSVPFLIGAAIPLQGRHELELLAGIGISVGSIRGGSHSNGSAFLQTTGITTELSVTYWAPITRAVDLSLGAAVTFAALHIENDEDGTLLRLAIPLRIGARWSL